MLTWDQPYKHDMQQNGPQRKKTFKAITAIHLITYSNKAVAFLALLLSISSQSQMTCTVLPIIEMLIKENFSGHE